LQQALAQLERGLELGALSQSQAMLGCQLRHTGVGEAKETAFLHQEALRQGHDILTGRAGTQDDGQQLGRGKGRGSILGQLLTRALTLRPLAHAQAVVRHDRHCITTVGDKR
jgi:hypothetical protein